MIIPTRMTQRRNNCILAFAFLGGPCLFALNLWALHLHANFFSDVFYNVFAACGIALSLSWFASAYICSLRKRLWLARLLLAMGSVGLSLCIGDLIITNIAFAPEQDTCLSRNIWMEKIPHWNSDGFWERDLEPFKDKASREQFVVAVVGDSFTVGQGLLNAKSRFTNQLEKLLRERENLPVAVLNFGIVGFGTHEQISMTLPIVAKVQPNMIVIAYLSNDITTTGPLPATHMISEIYPHTPSILRISPTANYFISRTIPVLSTLWDKGTWDSRLCRAYQNNIAFAAHKSEIETLIRQSKAIAEEVVFVILPFSSMWENDKALRDSVYLRIIDTAAQQGVTSLSLAHIEDEHPLDWFYICRSDPHPSKLAHLAIAESLLPTLAEMIRERHHSR